MQRRASMARTALENGDFKRVLSNLKYIKSQGDPATADKLLEFINTFAKKGAQSARKHVGLIKRGGGSWGVVKEIFTGLKLMGLPRANRLIRATLGVGPSDTSVSDRVRQMKDHFNVYVPGMDVNARLKRAACLWKPILQRKIKDGTLKPGQFVPVTCGADATPVPAHPQYCEDRNIITGLCGPNVVGHKCSTAMAEQILNGEDGQFINMIAAMTI